jgi:uncharacterized membrane-anchored protein
MEFVQHSINWSKGEIFEGTIIGAFGLAVLLAGILFFFVGNTSGAKAMLVPLAVLGLFYAFTGISMYQSNQKRIHAYEKSFAEDSAVFVQAEKKRVEDFQYMYTVTNTVAAVFFAVAIVFFFLSLNPHLRAVGIALVVFGLSGLTIDFFSKERADIYYGEIQSELDKSD